MIISSHSVFSFIACIAALRSVVMFVVVILVVCMYHKRKNRLRAVNITDGSIEVEEQFGRDKNLK